MAIMIFIIMFIILIIVITIILIIVNSIVIIITMNIVIICWYYVDLLPCIISKITQIMTILILIIM